MSTYRIPAPEPPARYVLVWSTPEPKFFYRNFDDLDEAVAEGKRLLNEPGSITIEAWVEIDGKATLEIDP